MSTKTAGALERSPIMSRNRLTDQNIASIVGHQWFNELAAEIDGWGELRRTAGQLSAYGNTETPSAEKSTFAVRILDGADPVEAAQAYSAARSLREGARLVNELLEQAQIELSNRAEVWVAGNAETIAAAVSRRMNESLAKARSLLSGPLVGIRTGEDLAEHPEMATDFAAFASLAREFQVGTALGRLLAGQRIDPDHSSSGEGFRYDVRLFSAYEAVWPEFWAAPQLQPPWAIEERSGAVNLDDPIRRLRYFAGVDATVNVAGSRQELQRRLSALEVRVREIEETRRG